MEPDPGLSCGVRGSSQAQVIAVRFLQHGVPMAVVSQWMGHSDVNLTVKRYGRFAADPAALKVIRRPV